MTKFLKELNMFKTVFWHGKSAYLSAQIGLCYSLKMYRKSASPYQNFAKNLDAKKQATSATKPLKPLVQEMKENTSNYALKAA